MGGKSSSPDYQGAAVAQGEANREVVRDQTFANRPDQFTPFGSVQWNPYQTVDPATGEATTAWQQVQSLTPELQSILNRQINMQGARTDLAGSMVGRTMNELGQPMDWGSLTPRGEVPTSQFTIAEPLQRDLDYSGAPEIGDPMALRARAEDTIYNRGAQRLSDRFGTQRRNMEVQLRNRGLRPGDEAYDSAMSGLAQAENDAFGGLAADTVRLGQSEAAQLFGQDVTRRNVATGEADRMGNFANLAGNQAFQQNLAANQQNFGQAMQGSQYANMIRQQQIAEEAQRRGMSLNEMNALLSGQQVSTPTMPNFTAASQAQPAPIFQGAVNQGNFNQMGQQSLFSGLTGIGSAAIGALF